MYQDSLGEDFQKSAVPSLLQFVSVTGQTMSQMYIRSVATNCVLRLVVVMSVVCQVGSSNCQYHVRVLSGLNQGAIRAESRSSKGHVRVLDLKMGKSVKK